MRAVEMLAVVAVTSAVALPGAAERPVAATSPSATSGTITATVLERLPERDLRGLRLLIQQPRPFDEVTLDAGKRYVAGSRMGRAPDGWSCAPKGDTWTCSGGPVEPGVAARFAWTSSPDVEIPVHLGLRLSYRGSRFHRDSITPTRQAGVEVADDLENVLDLPAGVTPGSLFLAAPAADLYRGGTWGLRIDDQGVPPADPADLEGALDLGGPIIRDRLFYRLPLGTTADSRLRFTYDDPWGDRIVDAPAPVWFFGPPGDEGCSPAGLRACQERVAVGTSVCVCGCFPEPFLTDLTLDGQPIPFPAAASTAMIRIPLPDVAPGAHTVAWGSVGQSVPFEAVALDGAVAQDQLLVGNSTVLDFHLRGTRAQLPILISLTEGGVAIQGGNTQIAFFDGGPRNQVQRTVLAESVGEFGIDYVLDLPPCPCGGWGERLLDDTELAVHSLVARGRADAISLAGDLRLPLSFASDSIVTRTPRPPFSPGDRLDIQFAQLGLRATAPGYGDILFEQRADMPSIANLSGVVPASGGGLEAGDAELSLHTQFSMPLGADNPFEVGGSYEFRLDGFELEGTSPGLGGLSFRQAPGAPGSIRFSDVAADAAGATLYGNADLTVRGRLALGIRTSF